MKKQVIVTGGAGYIGSHTVVSLIDAGYEPVIVDDFRNSEPFILERIAEISGQVPIGYAIDCCNQNDLAAVFEKHKNAVGVIHFAAYKAVGESVQKPIEYYENNIGSMIAVLKAMSRTGIENLVFSSSCTVYGQPDSPEVSEQTPIGKTSSPYGETKFACEELIRSVVSSGAKIKATLLRYFNPIGAHPGGKLGELPRGIPNNLVPFITQTAIGIRKELVVHGNDYPTPDGTNIRDYIHVVDLAEAHTAALKASLSKSGSICDVYNLGTGTGTSVLEIIHTFERVSGIKLKYTIGPRRKGDADQIWANPKKANDLLGWKCKLSVGDAVLHAWNWQKTLKQR